MLVELKPGPRTCGNAMSNPGDDPSRRGEDRSCHSQRDQAHAEAEENYEPVALDEADGDDTECCDRSEISKRDWQGDGDRKAEDRRRKQVGHARPGKDLHTARLDKVLDLADHR